MAIDQTDLFAFLDELLEAERAGARVTLESARTAADASTAALLMAIHRDETRWCAMLLRHIKAANRIPSTKVGAFYGKAMAITDLNERITFLNRGQGWVVRKLRDVLAHAGDESLRMDLSEMLRSHEENIVLANKAME